MKQVKLIDRWFREMSPADDVGPVFEASGLVSAFANLVPDSSKLGCLFPPFKRCWFEFTLPSEMLRLGCAITHLPLKDEQASADGRSLWL